MSEVLLTPGDRQFLERLIADLANSPRLDDRWAAHQWRAVYTWYQDQHAAETDPLVLPCSHCQGRGTIRVTPADVGPYGHTLLGALRGGAWYRTSDLPMHSRGCPSTRTMALGGLRDRGLLEKGEPAYATSGGKEGIWRLTAMGAALVRAMSPEEAAP